MEHFVLKKSFVLRKRFVLGFCAVLVLTFGPVRVASAQHWWHWRHTGQTGPGPMGAGADQKAESTKTHTGKEQLEKPTPLYTSPKSVGWWHKSPGPMGAGSEENFKWTKPHFRLTKPHFRKAQHEKLTPIYSSPRSVGWWHKSPGPAGAGSGN